MASQVLLKNTFKKKNHKALKRDRNTPIKFTDILIFLKLNILSKFEVGVVKDVLKTETRVKNSIIYAHLI